MRILLLSFIFVLSSCSYFQQNARPLAKDFLKKGGSGLELNELEKNLKRTSYMRFGNYQFDFTLLSADYIAQKNHPLLTTEIEKKAGQCVLMELELIAVEKKHHNFDTWNVYQRVSKQEKTKLDLISKGPGKLVRETRGSSPNYVWYQDAIYCGDVKLAKSHLNFLVTMNLDEKMDPKEAYTSVIKYRFKTLDQQKEEELETTVSNKVSTKKNKKKRGRDIFRLRTRKELAGEIEED